MSIPSVLLAFVIWAAILTGAAFGIKWILNTAAPTPPITQTNVNYVGHTLSSKANLKAPVATSLRATALIEHVASDYNAATDAGVRVQPASTKYHYNLSLQGANFQDCLIYSPVNTNWTSSAFTCK